MTVLEGPEWDTARSKVPHLVSRLETEIREFVARVPPGTRWRRRNYGLKQYVVARVFPFNVPSTMDERRWVVGVIVCAVRGLGRHGTACTGDQFLATYVRVGAA